MCLSTVYKSSSEENEPLCKNIARVEAEDGRLIFTDILGRQTTVNGTILTIDLTENIIRVKEAAVS